MMVPDLYYSIFIHEAVNEFKESSIVTTILNNFGFDQEGLGVLKKLVVNFKTVLIDLKVDVEAS